jgi:hypothetical protein
MTGRHRFLAGLHDRLRPRTYLEIGVNDGRSLALSHVPSIAVDPAFKVTVEIRADVHLVKATSDDFFARPDPLAHLRGKGSSTMRPAGADPDPGPDGDGSPVIDMAFIDGMHLFEFALRDFMNVERWCAPTSVIVFDDMLPRNVPEAARDRATSEWAGDVFKLIGVLRQYRPDLIVIPVDSRPTGLLVVLAPDAGSTTLQDHYDEILAANVVPDPQAVPDAILARDGAVNPAALLACDAWDRIVSARNAGTARSELEAVLRQALAGLVGTGSPE